MENLLFENIGVGLYTVYAIDENGCVDNTPGISIEQPQPFSLYAQAIVPTNCPDSEDGICGLELLRRQRQQHYLQHRWSSL